MKVLNVCLSCVLFSLTFTGIVEARDPIPSQYMDPFNRNRLSHAEYVRNIGPTALHTLNIRQIRQVQPQDSVDLKEQDLPMILLVVNDLLAPSIEDALDTFILDLTADSYQVVVSQVSGNSAELLRQEIQSYWGSDLEGVVLIGDCPVAWYELNDYWGGEHEEFPIELFFMDLDGTWSDADGDGIFDSHTGSVAPDIWVGRIDAQHFMDGDETHLIQNYFAKNHAYRTGTLTLPDRGLAFIDDDWTAWGNWNISTAYSNVVLVNSNNQTSAETYRTELQNGYEFVHLCAHSCPWVHVFLQNAGYAGCFFNFDLEMIEPEAFFYNLFSCSNARFVEWDCLGNAYLFKDTCGLGIVGSAKTGGMLDTEAFYPALGTGACLGEAFLGWFQYEAQGGFSLYEQSWFYGMALLGDPTLMIHQHGTRRPVDGKRSPSGWTPEWLNQTEYNGSWDTLSPLTDMVHSDGHPTVAAGPDGSLMAAWVSGVNGRASICSHDFTGGSAGWVTVDDYAYWEEDPVLMIPETGFPRIFYSRFNLDSYNHNIVHASWNGTSWSNPSPLHACDRYDLHPEVVEFQGNIHLFWQRWIDGTSRIYWSWEDGGTWTAPTDVSPGSDNATHPVAVRDNSGHLCLAYTVRNRGTWDIVFRRYNGYWTLPEYITGTDAGQSAPAMTAFNADEIWMAYVTDAEGNLDIAARRFNGSAWLAEERITSSGESDCKPQIAIANDVPVVTFQTRTGDADLFYALRNLGQWFSSVYDPASWNDQDAALVNDADRNTQIVFCTDRDGNTNIYADMLMGTEYHCPCDGDVTMDDIVTAGDAQLAFLIALGAYTPTIPERCSADCNGDEAVTAGDAQSIFQFALGGPECVDPIILPI